eukprot:scaffold662332_cov64-Prasinocladus_malaysianus.AAC.1
MSVATPCSDMRSPSWEDSWEYPMWDVSVSVRLGLLGVIKGGPPCGFELRRRASRSLVSIGASLSHRE